VRTLLERVPSLTCLVTSRQGLALSGEREFVVHPLPTPYHVESLEQLAGCASVQLFVDRAQAVRPDFQVTVANATAVAELCRRLEGLPLALELAAARSAVLTPAQLLTQLTRRFELLVSRQRDATPRHRSLRAAIEWSYHLLSPVGATHASPLQRFFARLSVFRGGWTLAAAECVCDQPAALASLEQLQACSLLVAEETGPEMRYRLLETLREFAAEQLPAAEQAELARRHATFYLARAEEAEPHLSGPDQAAWMDELEREHDNLRAALRWSLAPMPGAGSQPDEIGLRLAVALVPFWRERGDMAEGRERLSELLAAVSSLPASSPTLAEAPSDPLATLRARALAGAGTLAIHHGDYEAARRFCWESLAAAELAGDRSLVGTCFLRLGMVARDQGDLEEARTLLEEGLAVLREVGHQQQVAWSLCYLGDLSREQGDVERARALYEEARALLRGQGNEKDVGWMNTRLGRVAWRGGELDAAHSLYEEALALFQRMGHPLGIAATLGLLGELALYRGDSEHARRLGEESLRMRREVGNPRDIAWTLVLLGRAALAQGDLEAARSFLTELMAIAQALEDAESFTCWRCHLGALAWQQGDRETARSRFTECLAARPELREGRGLAESLEGLAAIAQAEGRTGRAARLFGAAQAVRDVLHTPRPPHEQTAYETAVRAAQASVGWTAWQAAWTAGRQMPTVQAIEYALGHSDLPEPD
jgi:predicted ATPase